MAPGRDIPDVLEGETPQDGTACPRCSAVEAVEPLPADGPGRYFCWACGHGFDKEKA